MNGVGEEIMIASSTGLDSRPQIDFLFAKEKKKRKSGLEIFPVAAEAIRLIVSN